VIDSVVQAAVDAGEIIQRVRREAFDVEYKKGDAGPVTEADRQADSLLKERLLALEDAAWLSEETADDKSRLSPKRVWIVDPLDGTKEFVKGLPEYTVAIALVEDGEPILGVVHNPVTGETFWAERTGGAWFSAQRPVSSAQPSASSAQRVVVADGRRLLASRSEITRGEFAPFESDWEIRPVGSIQYKLALVAAGKGAATFSRGPKHEWDVAAGALIVAEAGGIVTDLDGRPLKFNQPFPKTRGILAAAPTAYERLVERLAEVGASDRMAELD
jgi:myo-inositol-1(or 4)-monophosphatase